MVAKYEWEKPPLLRLKEYHLDYGFSQTYSINAIFHSDVLEYTRECVRNGNARHAAGPIEFLCHASVWIQTQTI